MKILWNLKMSSKFNWHDNVPMVNPSGFPVVYLDYYCILLAFSVNTNYTFKLEAFLE